MHRVRRRQRWVPVFVILPVRTLFLLAALPLGLSLVCFACKKDGQTERHHQHGGDGKTNLKIATPGFHHRSCTRRDRRSGQSHRVPVAHLDRLQRLDDAGPGPRRADPSLPCSSDGESGRSAEPVRRAAVSRPESVAASPRCARMVPTVPSPNGCSPVVMRYSTAPNTNRSARDIDFAAHLLRSHVRRRADDGALARQHRACRRGTGRTEIEHLDASHRRLQPQIGRLDVAVDDAAPWANANASAVSQRCAPLRSAAVFPSGSDVPPASRLPAAA